MRSIRLKNIRSHSETEIDLSPSLNVIVGPTDSGKSNIVRALAAMTEPDSATAMIRDGHQSGSIEVRFTDGQRATVTRKAQGGGVYRVADSRDRDIAQAVNPGRTIPPHVVDAIGLGASDLGGLAVNLHIQTQREAALLVDDAPGRAAKIIGSVSGADVAFRAAAEAKRLALEATRTADALDRAAADAEAQRSIYESRTPALRAASEYLRLADAASVQAESHARAVAEADHAVHTIAAALSGVATPGAIEAAAEAVKSASGPVSRLAASRDLAIKVNTACDSALAAVDDFVLAERQANMARDEYNEAARAVPRCKACGQFIRSQTGPTHDHTA
jgi:energy-coupling factor transporter ATP-binding protein EcfA2